MGKDNLKSLWYRFLLVIILGGLIVSFGCGGGDSDDSDDWENDEQTHWSSTVIGPEGGVIEVTDPGSSIYGFKIEIPEGAFDSDATIIVHELPGIPNLPAGLKSRSPEFKITADAPFLKEIQIFFPLQNTSDNNKKMICAFYWDSVNSAWWEIFIPEWLVVIPESMNDNTMSVSTQHSGSWRWGEVLLDEVEIETIEPLLDETFGPDYMDKLETAMVNKFGQLWGNWDYCANRFEIAKVVKGIREDAKIRAEVNLESVNKDCNDVFGLNPTVGDIFYGINEFIDIHLQYLGENIAAEGLSLVPYIGGILEICGKAYAEALYKQRLENLANDYKCIFEKADSELWLDIGLYFVADAALLGMALAETYSPCP